MANSYMGNILNVDLTTGNIDTEALDENICRDYIGGYGIGARLLYDRIPAGADPLGPDNILGLLTGPLTGTPPSLGRALWPWPSHPKQPAAGGMPTAAAISDRISSLPAMMVCCSRVLQTNRFI